MYDEKKYYFRQNYCTTIKLSPEYSIVGFDMEGEFVVMKTLETRVPDHIRRVERSFFIYIENSGIRLIDNFFQKFGTEPIWRIKIGLGILSNPKNCAIYVNLF